MNLEIALIVSSEIIYLIVTNFKVAEESLAFHLPNQEMKKRNELVRMAASEIKMHHPSSDSKLFY
jgi:Lhr-like helicase